MAGGLDEAIRVLLQQMGGLYGRSLQSIDDERQRAALQRTAAFVEAQMPRARSFSEGGPYEAKIQLLEHALDLAPAEGLVLEFGVATGDTLRRITAKRSPSHGFDSFEGLPEDWRTGYEKGAFAMAPPQIEGATLHVGWFDDTLPGFLEAHPEPVAFLHLDADLYSSTRTVLLALAPRLRAGTVIVFDEYFNFPGWEHDEHKAFMEFIERTGHGFEYLAYNGLHEQVLVRLTS